MEVDAWWKWKLDGSGSLMEVEALLNNIIDDPIFYF